MTATPETTTAADDKPHQILYGLPQQADYVFGFARAGRQAEALEHAAAVEGLLAAYRIAAGEWEPEAIHRHFGLSYANYLVLPRSFLQSMPDAWQARFVALLDELDEAFQHVPQADDYRVEAATEHLVNEMTEAELAEAGIEADWYAGETAPEGLSAEEFAEWRAQHEQDRPNYYRIGDGEELDPHSRVLLPVPDPVPHYDRGRTRIQPRLGGGE